MKNLLISVWYDGNSFYIDGQTWKVLTATNSRTITNMNGQSNCLIGRNSPIVLATIVYTSFNLINIEGGKDTGSKNALKKPLHLHRWPAYTRDKTEPCVGSRGWRVMKYEDMPLAPDSKFSAWRGKIAYTWQQFLLKPLKHNSVFTADQPTLAILNFRYGTQEIANIYLLDSRDGQH